MAAAARPPGLGDARVPCPLCGGLVHPVAGRCKHCKEDLSTLRAGRPQAAAVLPALNGKLVTAGAAAASPVALSAPSALPAANAAEPILPQRRTGGTIVAQRPGGSLLRNWPLIVIVLAVIAIVVAVVIMVMPPDQASGGKRQLMPTPAPDRMNTMPDNRQGSVDPWAPDPGDPNPNAVPRNAPVPPPVIPDDPDPDLDDPGDPDDLYGGLGTSMNSAFMLSMVKRACERFSSCPNVDNPALALACSQFGAMPIPPAATTCASAQRCLAAIDAIDCDATSQSVNPINTVMAIQDCMKAITDC